MGRKIVATVGERKTAEQKMIQPMPVEKIKAAEYDEKEIRKAEAFCLEFIKANPNYRSYNKSMLKDKIYETFDKESKKIQEEIEFVIFRKWMGK